MENDEESLRLVQENVPSSSSSFPAPISTPLEAGEIMIIQSPISLHIERTSTRFASSLSIILSLSLSRLQTHRRGRGEIPICEKALYTFGYHCGINFNNIRLAQ